MNNYQVTISNSKYNTCQSFKNIILIFKQLSNIILIYINLLEIYINNHSNSILYKQFHKPSKASNYCHKLYIYMLLCYYLLID